MEPFASVLPFRIIPWKVIPVVGVLSLAHSFLLLSVLLGMSV